MEPLHRAPKQYSKILESINEIGRAFGETGQFDQEKLQALAGPEIALANTHHRPAGLEIYGEPLLG